MSGRHFLCLRGSWCQGALPRRLSHSKHVAGPAGEVKGQGICPFRPVLGRWKRMSPVGFLQCSLPAGGVMGARKAVWDKDTSPSLKDCGLGSK